MIVQRFVMLLPGFGSFLKHAIVDKSGTAKGMSKLKFLLLCWKESEFESLANVHGYPITQSVMLCKVIASEGDAKFIPHINERVFFGGVDKMLYSLFIISPKMRQLRRKFSISFFHENAKQAVSR